MTGAGTAIYWNDMPHSGVMVRADRSGGVAVLCGATDIGQGSDSILAYLVAEVLGIDPKDIRVHPADTDLTPVDLGSYSSRVTLMCGQRGDPGGRAAARQASSRRWRRSSRSSPATSWPATGACSASATTGTGRDLRGGGRARRGDARRPGVPRLLRAAASAPGSTRAAASGPSPCYSYSACVVEVDVDEETGEVEPTRSGSPTTSAARSTRCSSRARSRARSTWASARR